jgi:hypothetical protein
MIRPGQPLQNAINVINQTMKYSGVEYWLCFGGLWGLIMNEGTIPDGDLDICVRYGDDYKRIQKAFAASPGGYAMSKALLDDTDRSKALYCGYGSRIGLPHICLSFWYPHKGLLFYCHDQHFEVKGEGVPPSGYFFKGVPEHALRDFKVVEWPGIVQSTKINVPMFPGVVLDHLYPAWAYRKQKYLIDKKNTVEPEKMVSYHKGGAISPYRVHVKSMAEFKRDDLIAIQLKESEKKYRAELKLQDNK